VKVVLAVGVEVQNTVIAIYGADILAGAGWFQERKSGHAYFSRGNSVTVPVLILKNMAGRKPGKEWPVVVCPLFVLKVL
jgi:hypothetical protein